jgi:hypothetical protein
MVKINENDIIKILQEAQKPLGPTEITEKLNLKKTDKTKVHYSSGWICTSWRLRALLGAPVSSVFHFALMNTIS